MAIEVVSPNSVHVGMGPCSTPCQGLPQPQKSCSSWDRMSAWTCPTGGPKASTGPRRFSSEAAPSPWPQPSASLTLMWRWGAPETRGWWGKSALRRLPHLPTFDRRVRVVSTLITPLGGCGLGQGFRPRGTGDSHAAGGLESNGFSRAKEIVFTVPAKGRQSCTPTTSAGSG